MILISIRDPHGPKPFYLAFWHRYLKNGKPAERLIMTGRSEHEISESIQDWLSTRGWLNETIKFV